MMIAQVPTASAGQIGMWLVAFAAVLVIFNQGVKAWKFMSGHDGGEIRPQPLQVQAAIEFVRQEDCKGRHNLNASRIEELSGQIVDLGKKREEDLRLAAQGRKALYESIRQFSREASDHTESVRKELGGKMDDLPNQIIATLKNTGAI